MMKNNNELKELRFNLTHDMTNNFIKILVIEQMIKKKHIELTIYFYISLLLF